MTFDREAFERLKKPLEGEVKKYPDHETLPVYSETYLRSLKDPADYAMYYAVLHIGEGYSIKAFEKEKYVEKKVVAYCHELMTNDKQSYLHVCEFHSPFAHVFASGDHVYMTDADGILGEDMLVINKGDVLINELGFDETLLIQGS